MWQILFSTKRRELSKDENACGKEKPSLLNNANDTYAQWRNLYDGHR